MGAVFAAMIASAGVGVVVLAVVGWLHHLAGSADAQARLRRRRFQLLWHAYRIRLRATSATRVGRRHLAARMTDAAEQTTTPARVAPRRVGAGLSA